MNRRRSASLLALPLTVAVAAHGSSAAQVGSVLRYQKINELHGGFGGSLAGDDYFGLSLVGLGDVNGDGIGDVAVAAPYDDDGGPTRGAVWILFLNANLTVLGQQKISQTHGGFTATLPDNGAFGSRLANVGDLDGDGLDELAVLAGNPTRFYVLFLNANGTVRSYTENRASDPAFVPATLARHWGGALVGLGDLDGDGFGDLALGAPHDPDGGPDTGAVWIVRLDFDGSIKSAHKISNSSGGFTGTIEEGAQFGGSLVQLGDLDGDGNRELGVVAKWGGVLGEFWILHLDASELVASHQSFDYHEYGLLQESGGSFGTAAEYAWLGDLDGDGVGELAMGFGQHDFPGGALYEGGFATGFLRADGTFEKKLRVSSQRGGMGDLPRGSAFGERLAALGDLDGDGSPELAVGAYYDRAAGEDTGAIWLVSLDTSATRNGSGVNPLTLTQTADPVFATSWTATLDCSAHASGLAYLFGRSRPISGVFTPYGEILIDGNLLLQLQQPHAGGPVPFTMAVPPYSIALVDLPLFVQGVCTGAPGIRLGNALDVLVGE